MACVEWHESPSGGPGTRKGIQDTAGWWGDPYEGCLGALRGSGGLQGVLVSFTQHQSQEGRTSDRGPAVSWTLY